MSSHINYLHSHSALERKLPTSRGKFHVLVDEKYKDLFPMAKEFNYGGVTYYWAPTFLFYEKGGIFKNLEK